MFYFSRKYSFTKFASSASRDRWQTFNAIDGMIEKPERNLVSEMSKAERLSIVAFRNVRECKKSKRNDE
jgi:hypothetical protein